MSTYNKIRRFIAKNIVNKKISLNLSKPIVSFTFDDAPDSAFTQGANILKKYGYQGTYYVALGLFEKNRPGGGYNPYYLKEVIEQGGELACHTYNHIHFYNSNKKTIVADLEKNHKKLNELIPGYRFNNFSYPYGEQTITAKRILMGKYKSARGVNQGINTNVVDLINLKACSLGHLSKIENAIALIKQTIQLNGWLIFYTHEVELHHSKNGCTPQLLEGVVNYCSQNNISVLTIEKALQTIENR